MSSVSGYGQVPGHDTDDLTSHVHQLKPTRPISSHHHLERFQITVARSPKPALMTIGLLGCHHMTRWKRILLGRRREYPSPTSFPFFLAGTPPCYRERARVGTDRLTCGVIGRLVPGGHGGFACVIVTWGRCFSILLWHIGSQPPIHLLDRPCRLCNDDRRICPSG